MNTVKEKNPSFEYRFWGNESLSEFGLEHLDAKPIIISDLLRIKILEKYGGIYIDADFQCLQPIEPLLQNHEKYNGLSVIVQPQLDVPNSGVIFSPKNFDYSRVIVDFDLNKARLPFLLRRLYPQLISRKDVGNDGKYLRHLDLDTWGLNSRYPTNKRKNNGN